jgi:hypothetical protein
VQVVPEALTIDPLKQIWERDKGRTKEQARGEFAFIKFMLHPGKDNPFYGYPEIHPETGERQRQKKILEKIVTPIPIDPQDKWIITAMAWYSQIVSEASPTKRYYDACVLGMDKQVSFLEQVDFNERDKKGMAVYKPIDTDRILKSAGETMESLVKLRTRMEEEIFQATKTRNDRTINKYERRPNS